MPFASSFNVLISLPVLYSRGYFDAVPILRLTEPLLGAVANETKVSGQLGSIGETISLFPS